jgi:hypothetical protein
VSGYVVAGYSIVLVALGCFAISLLVRERAARRRLLPSLPRHEQRGRPEQRERPEQRGRPEQWDRRDPAGDVREETVR